MEARKGELRAWEEADEESRPIHPEWRGQKDWKWQEKSKAVVAAAVAAAIPRGESKDLLSLAPYQASRSITTKLAAYVGGNDNFASFLLAIIVVVITMFAWYGMYQAAKDVKAYLLTLWRGRMVRDETPRVVTYRTVGVQSQCTYTWHQDAPRFKAFQNGFKRSGEVSISSE